MNDARIVRICFMLAGIFAAGLVTGRLTAPQPTPAVASPRARVQTPATFVGEMGRRVGIDIDQQDRIRPIIRQMVREMQPYPPRTQPRLDIFLKTMGQVRPFIHQDQLAAFDRFAQEQADNIRRNIERNERSKAVEGK